MAATSKFFFTILLIVYNVMAIVEAPHQNGWCIPDPSASEDELKKNIQYSCDILGDFCDIIRPGGACYIPNTIQNHASVVMNEYYFTSGGNEWNCDFKGSALLTFTDPSYGECKYKVIKGGRSDSSRMSFLLYLIVVASHVVFLLVCVIIV